MTTTKPKRKAATARVVTNDDLIGALEDLRGHVDQVSARINETDNRVVKAKKIIRWLKGKVRDLRAERFENLAKIEDLMTKPARHDWEDLEELRQYITKGRTGDALHLLNRLLGESDPTHRRTSVVAPVLPMAGGFGS